MTKKYSPSTRTNGRLDPASLSQGQTERVAELFKLGGYPLRLRVLCELAERSPRTPNDLKAVVDRELTTVSYHIRLLADAGALELQRLVERRGALEHYYCVGVLGRELVALHEALIKGAHAAGFSGADRCREREIARVAQLFALGADSLRLRILLALAAESPQSPSEISQRLGCELTDTSYHVRCLSAAGALLLQRTARHRGAIKHFYVLGRSGEQLAEFASAATTARSPRRSGRAGAGA